MEQPQRNRPGSFRDFVRKFGQLGQPPVLLLCNPVPPHKYRLHPKVGRCPAAHNRALFDGLV